MPAVKVADTRQMPREKWLELRHQGVGGSDATAILGLNPYKSPLSKEENLAMALGRELEPFLRRRFTRWLKEQEGFSDLLFPASCILYP